MRSQLPRNIVLLGLLSMWNDIASQMVYPLIPKLLVDLGTSVFLIGVIEGVAEATASFFKPVAGRMSDRMQRRKPFIWLGYGLSTLAKPLFALAYHWLPVLGIRFLDRLGKALRNPPRDALIAGSVPKDRKGWAFGIHRTFDKLGSVIGPLIAMAILWAWPEQLKWVFIAAFLPGLIGLLFIPRVQEVRSSRKVEKEDDSMAASPLAFKLFLLSIVLFSLGNSSNAFLILKADEVGLPIFYLPLLWAFYNLVCAISAPFLGSLSDRIGRPVIIRSSFILYALIYVGFAWVDQVSWLWLLFGFYGIHYGLTKGVFKAYIADLAPNAQLAAFFGRFEMWVGLSLVAASILMGFLWQFYGSDLAFYNSAGLSLLALLIFSYGERIWHSRRKSTQKENSLP